MAEDLLLSSLLPLPLPLPLLLPLLMPCPLFLPLPFVLAFALCSCLCPLFLPFLFVIPEGNLLFDSNPDLTIPLYRTLPNRRVTQLIDPKSRPKVSP